MGVEWSGGKIDRWEFVVPAVVVCTFGAGMLVHATFFDDDPPPVDATVDATMVLDATTIEMHGYGPDGKPGEFLYDCKYEAERLVCTQQEEPAP